MTRSSSAAVAASQAPTSVLRREPAATAQRGKPRKEATSTGISVGKTSASGSRRGGRARVSTREEGTRQVPVQEEEEESEGSIEFRKNV
ncbi:unnamed protein product [Arabis nemorensis]|nr:unnamed protein product [Arabis nemorensis]